MSVGLLGHVGLKEETTFGMKATPPDAYGEIKSESLSMNNGLIIPRYVGGIRSNKRIMLGALTVDGSINYDFTPEDIFPWLLKGMFGTVNTSSLGLGAYEHVFTVKEDSNLPSFTVEVDAEASAAVFLGSKISKMGLSINPYNGLLEGSFDLISQTMEAITATSPTYADIDPFLAYQMAITLNGVSNVDFESLSLNFTNEMEGVKTLNTQRYIGKVVAKKFDCSGSFTLEYDNDDIRKRLWGSSVATAPLKEMDPGSLVVEVTHYDDISTSAVKYYLKIEFFNIYFATAPANIKGADDRIMQDVAFNTKYSASDAAMVEVTLRNGVSTYV